MYTQQFKRSVLSYLHTKKYFTMIEEKNITPEVSIQLQEILKTKHSLKRIEERMTLSQRQANLLKHDLCCKGNQNRLFCSVYYKQKPRNVLFLDQRYYVFSIDNQTLITFIRLQTSLSDISKQKLKKHNIKKRKTQHKIKKTQHKIKKTT